MYYQNETDETLVMLTLAGEQRAYEVLVIRYQKAVIASAISVTKNHFMAEDAAQDAFVTAWMKLNTLQDPKKYASWVCRIAKNCALNMINRYRSFLPLDVAETLNISDDGAQNPAELYALSEERSEVNKSVGMLPEKVKQIIHLHYFEGLSIAEIADRMRISEGTVKWQLHDGRKRIRKELCAMNEKYSDTLVQRVMKKVEELKLWQLKNDKNGFEKVYKDVLREVEELPECTEKQHALADVLARGWWWIPGKKNDALFARIANAAMEGKNEEVMDFIVSREDSNVYGEERIAFIRDKQIPRLEKAGFVKTLGREWFWLGYELLRNGKQEESTVPFNKVEEILQKNDGYRNLVPYAKTIGELLLTRYKDTVEERYRVEGNAEEYRIIDGKLCYWKEQGIGYGYLGSVDRMSGYIFRNASCCDSSFFADISVGESYIGSDETKLTYISDSESVDTPAGKFENCQLWEIRRWTDCEKIICRTFYKDGVGIVRQEHISDGALSARTLSSYEIKGGSGLIPMFAGNTWEYVAGESPDALLYELKYTVSFADDERVILCGFSNAERINYDENSWLDMIQQIPNDYVHSKKNGDIYVCDISPVIERAEQLAVTPMEKAHTKAAASVARRIMETDPTFNPNYTKTGHWNFFTRNYIRKKQDRIFTTDYDSRWCFELKCMGVMNGAEDPLLYNDVLGILQDATNCLWSDEWRIGATPIVEYTKWDRTVKTQINCEDGGTITTKAGTFENCFKLSLDIGGMSDGWTYRGGKKVYYFAEGVGIVRTENEYCSGAKTAVYELTSYEGVGEGFMPIADGFVRRYDALDMTDGFVGAVEYTYVADEDGDIVVFTDRTGIREVPPPITQYSAIQGEVIEENLWESGKREESRLRHDINNFKLLMHFLGRDNRTWAAAKKAVAWGKYHIGIVEFLAEGGEIPRAWLGRYWRAHFYTACASFGCKTEESKEEGYRYLERAFELYPKWAEIPDGEALEVGNELIYGGIKVIKGKGLIQLPDGSQEPYDYDYLLNPGSDIMYYGMTAPRGWEWFNPVRNEERFKEYVERAKKLANK